MNSYHYKDLHCLSGCIKIDAWVATGIHPNRAIEVYELENTPALNI